jgi:hypothetical protein
MGETHNIGTDMPGSEQCNASFTSVSSAGSSWNGSDVQSIPWTNVLLAQARNWSNAAWYCTNTLGTDNFNIWTSDPKC